MPLAPPTAAGAANMVFLCVFFLLILILHVDLSDICFFFLVLLSRELSFVAWVHGSPALIVPYCLAHPPGSLGVLDEHRPETADMAERYQIDWWGDSGYTSRYLYHK